MKGCETNLYLIIAELSYPSGFRCEADTNTSVMSRQPTFPSKARAGFAGSVRINSHEPHIPPGRAQTLNGAAGAPCLPPEGPPRLGEVTAALTPMLPWKRGHLTGQQRAWRGPAGAPHELCSHGALLGRPGFVPRQGEPFLGAQPSGEHPLPLGEPGASGAPPTIAARPALSRYPPPQPAHHTKSLLLSS